MKHFFMLLMLFMWSTAVCAEMPAVASIQSFRQSLTDEFERTKNLSADELSLRDYPENFSIFSFVLWDARGAGPLTGTKGLGPWVETEFVKARWISCYSGTKGTPEFISGIQMVPQKGWVLRPPVIPAATERAFASETVLKPVTHPLPVGQTKTTQYETEVFFPVFASLREAGTPLTLQKSVRVTGCKDGQCIEAVLPLTLTMSGSEHLPTAVCGGLIHQLQSTPVLPQGAATVTATRNDAGAIQLVFQFKEAVEGLAVQIDNDFSFTQQKMHVTGRTAYVILTPDKPVSAGEVLHIKALSSAGWFDMKAPLQNGEFTVSQPDFSWMNAFVSGLLLFVFSPFWMLLFAWCVDDAKTFLKQVRDVRRGIVGGGIGAALLWGTGVLPMTVFLSEPITFAIGMIAAVALIIKPVTGVGTAWLLFWLTPKPFLDETILQSNDWYPFAVCALWTVLLLFPFNWVSVLSDSFLRFYRERPMTLRPVAVLARLPLMLLLGWGVLVQVVPPLVLSDEAPYHPTTVREAVQSGHAVFLTVTDGMDTAAAFNRLVSGRVYPAKAWRKRGELLFMTLGLNTPAGQQLRRHLALPQRPFAVLYGPALPNGMIIDGRIAEEKWHGLMKQVRPQ